MANKLAGYIVCGHGRPLHWMENDMQFCFADMQRRPVTVFQTHKDALCAAARSDPEEVFQVYRIECSEPTRLLSRESEGGE